MNAWDPSYTAPDRPSIVHFEDSSPKSDLSILDEMTRHAAQALALRAGMLPKL
jgi:hypothetical protein